MSRSLAWCIVFAVALTACDKGPTAQERNALRENTQLKSEVAALKRELEELKKNDSYFYRKVLDARKLGNYAQSNELAKDLLDRFPASSLKPGLLRLIAQNTEAMAQDMLTRAKDAVEAQNLPLAQERLTDLARDYRGTAAAREGSKLSRRLPRLLAQAKRAAAEQAKREEAEQLAAQERAERENAQLELLSWNWSSNSGYAIAEGQIKNLTGERLENVTAVVSFFDSSNNFITSDEALIQFNPILPGQVSPWKVMAQYNPEMHHARVEFKFLMGETLSVYRKRKD